jgi:hypothetical protein
VAVAVAAASVSSCGGSSPAPPPPTETISVVTTRPPATSTTSRTTTTTAPVRVPKLIHVLPGALRSGVFGWTPAVAVRGRTAVWIARVGAHGEPGFTVTLLRFDQALVRLALHAGGSQPGGSGWPYPDAVMGPERHRLVIGFNSAFQESYGAGGFLEGGRVGWPLLRGKASVVIYRDGHADIGRWRVTVPAGGQPVEAVRQNLGLLINGGQVAPSVDSCIKRCWGDPLHEQPVVARAGLGVTAAGDLVWAAGHDLSVRALADALAGHGVVRAMELDINPAWVAGYAYAHPRHGPPAPIPLMPGQTGIPGQFLTPYYRDFFTVDAR